MSKAAPKKMPTNAPFKRALSYSRGLTTQNGMSYSGWMQDIACQGWCDGYRAALADMRKRAAK